MSVTTKDLNQAASRYLKANEKATSALSELGDLIWQAQEEDMAINEIARVTGLARSRVHYILNQQSKKRNEETKYNRVRAWLRERGYDVGDYGSVSESLIQDYDNWVKREEAK